MDLRMALLVVPLFLAACRADPVFQPVITTSAPATVVPCAHQGDYRIPPGTGTVKIYSEDPTFESEREEIAHLVGFAGREFAQFRNKKVAVRTISVCLTSRMDDVDKALFITPKKTLLAAFANDTIYVNRDVLRHKGDLYHEMAHYFNAGQGLSSEEDERIARAFEKHLSENHHGVQR